MAVLDWLIHAEQEYNLRPIRGNHDIMMLSARNRGIELQSWLDAGGDKTLQSFANFDESVTLGEVNKKYFDFLETSLLPFYECETHFFVHANAYPDIPLEDQPDFMLYWEQFGDPAIHECGKIMICGHTSQKSGVPFSNGNAVCIDTWGYGGGWLSCLDVDSGRIWQANERGETRKFWLDEI